MRLAALMLLVASVCVCCATAVHPVVESQSLARESGLVCVFLELTQPEPGLAPITELAVVRDDGTAFPVGLVTRQPDANTRGQQLVARGSAPVGRYAGLTVRTTATTDPVRLPLAFTLDDRQGIVIDLTRDDRIGSDGAARLEYRAALGMIPATGVMGLVSYPDEAVVALIDKRTGAIGGIVPTGRRPTGVVMSRDRRRAYVAVSRDDEVASIDLERGAIQARRGLRSGDEPVDIELVDARGVLLVVNRGSGTLSFVEPESLAEIDRVTVGSGPSSLLVDAAGRRAFVFNSRGTNITVVDIGTRQVSGSIVVDSGPLRGQFNRAQDRMWVMHDASPYVTILNPNTLAVVQRLFVGVGASFIKIDPQTDRVYVARADGKGVAVFDPQSMLPIDTLPIPGRVTYLSIEGESNSIAASLPESRTVRSFGLIGRAARWTASFDAEPYYVRFAGER